MGDTVCVVFSWYYTSFIVSSHYLSVVQAGLEFIILLPKVPQCWDFWHVL